MSISSKAEATVKGIKDLSGELSAWEGRLLAVQNQVDSLNRMKETLEKEIQEKKLAHNVFIERSQGELADVRSALNAEKESFAAQKVEFAETVTAFKKDKNAFEREKTAALDMKADLEAQMNKVTLFIRTVREYAEKL